MIKRLPAIVAALGVVTATAYWFSQQPTSPAKAPTQATTPAPTASEPTAKTLNLESILLEHPLGQVPAQASLTYRFNEAVVPLSQLGKTADGLLQTSPEKLFTSVWLDQSTLQLTPISALPSGQHVQFTLLGKALSEFGLIKSAEDFHSSIDVTQQRLSLKELGFTVDQDVVSYGLEVYADDDVSEEQLKQLLVLDQSTAKDASLYFGQVSPKRWNVSVIGLSRGPGSFRLRWKHQLQDTAFAAERVLQLPMPDVLSVLSTRFNDQDGQRFEIRFSQPLASQELAGLVKLNDKNARARINGNELEIFPDRKLSGNVSVWIAPTVKAATGESLGSPYQHSLQVSSMLPAVKFIGSGSIMPRGERLLVPIEATNINAIQLRVFQIFPDNIPQLLQNSDDNFGTWRSEDVGRYLSERSIPLSGAERDKTDVYQLDVTDLVGKYRGSIFRLEARILPEQSLYPCDVKLQNEPLVPLNRLNNEGYYKQSEIPERLWSFYRSRGDYEWSERDNPCKPTFYNNNRDTVKTIIASNIGIIAKAGKDGLLHVFTTALDQGQPMADVTVTAYNYQQQPIGSAQTDSQGMATLKPEGESFFLKADKDGDTGYLKVVGNSSLPTNQFDTGGSSSNSGVKAFFYAERNVWRPGDAIYLNLILQDKAEQIPADFPVTVDFFSPQGQKVSSVTARPVGAGFYRFDLSTSPEAATGNYTAVAKVADNYSDTVLKIENILPNRLKIDLTLPDVLSREPTSLTLKSNWLSGATAEGLKADVELKLNAAATEFDGYQGYRFDDDRRAFNAQKAMVWQGKLGPTGEAPFVLKPELNAPAPGALHALFIMRVFEPSGQFSTQFKQSTLHPYTRYAGLSIPTEYQDSPLPDDGKMTVSTVVLDPSGQKQAAAEVQVTLYKLRWSWWWDNDDNSSSYSSDYDSKQISQFNVTADASGFGSFTINASDYEHGRYRAVVCDTAGDDAHCASDIFYVGWGWDEQQGRDSATRLGISADKEQYQVGDTAHINLPAGTARQVLLTVENGSQVLEKRWYSLQTGQNSIDLVLDKRMVPNVYAHVSQVLPHQNRPSDMPLRSYGLVNLAVSDPTSLLAPHLEIPSEVKPESQFTVKVTEQQGQTMTYTLALVDEGLLGITDFKTPQPHNAFFRREALGVRTWDLFDQVVGAYASDLSRLLAVGGSELIAKRDNKRMQRFKPLVQTFGPFVLEAGKTAEHQISLPPYIGAVRAMLVAGNGYAYGQTEATVKVRQDLDLLTTAPRLVGPGDEFSLPVTLFWQGKSATKVQVSVSGDDVVEVVTAKQSADFTAAGEQTVVLKLKALDKTGTATLKVQASNGSLTATETIHLPLRAPNAVEQRVVSHLLMPGESWQPKAARFGIAGSNQQWFNVNALQNFDLTSYLNNLSDYPHGCVEQSTSRVLPLLFAGRYQPMTVAQKEKMTRSVNDQLRYLGGYQLPDGRFSYWRDGEYYVEWADLYAGYFMVKAKGQGFAMPQPSFNNWLNYHKTRANQFDGRGDDELIQQAFRLWVLSMADSADQGAMNRLRDVIRTDSKQPLPRLMLALAYLELGQQAAARELADSETLSTRQAAHSVLSNDSIQSLLRIKAQHALGQQTAAFTSAQSLLKETDIRYGATVTQALTAQILTELFSKVTGDAAAASRRFSLTEATQPLDIELSHAGYSLALPNYQAEQFKVSNTGSVPMYVSLLQQGIPAAGTEQPVSQGLQIRSQFTDLAGQPVDIKQIRQGSDVIALLTIENTTADALPQLAVSQLFAAGFELRSALLAQEEQATLVSHQKSGDDRLYTYLDLGPKGSRDSKVVLKATLNASYAGRFYLPGWSVQSMYTPTVRASAAGQWVEIVP